MAKAHAAAIQNRQIVPPPGGCGQKNCPRLTAARRNCYNTVTTANNVEGFMNITELRYLVAIMKWGSVSAAAKQLYAAQPNVSKALKNLEEEYGLRIFERSSTGMIPTEQGKRFIRQAQRVLQQVDELAQEAHPQRSCAELRVVLTHATYASYAAVDFLQQAARSEQLRVHIRESGAIEALDFVLRQGYRHSAAALCCRGRGLLPALLPAPRSAAGAYHGVFPPAAYQSGQPARRGGRCASWTS